MLRQYLNKKQDIGQRHLSGLRFEKIKSIEFIGIKPVYNLTANTTNTYIANNIVTHNTRSAYEMFYNPDKYDIISFEDV